MAPNDNWGADDFVLIDNPVRIVALQDAPGESSIESGYVTVSTDDATTAAKQDTPTAPTPAEYKQRMVEIKNFQPMPLRAFPEELSNTLLIGPFTNKHQDLDDKVNGPSCPVHLDEVLIKNSIVLFECFFHFKDLYPKIGRDNMLYMVGRACELSCADSTSLKQRVGRTLDALADGRAKFTRTYASDVDVSKPEDADVEELAWLVDEHVNLGLQEPQTVDDMWYKNPGIGSLWSAWQKVLKKKKRLAVTNGEKKNAASQNTDTGSERSTLIAEAVQAAARLGDALTQLGVRGGSSELSESEKHLIEEVTLGTKRLTVKIDQPRRQ